MKKLGFGTMRLPLLDPQDEKSIDQEQVNAMADLFLSKGFTYVDTAYAYHEGASEVACRRAFTERYDRDKFLLADKMPSFLIQSEQDYDRFFAEQLERCGVSYFDYYLLHNLGTEYYARNERFGGFEYMQKLKADGTAKHIGFSFHDQPELLEEILTAHPEMEFVQLQINYADWENENVQARRCYEIACRHQKDVIVMEPVKGGGLANLPHDAELLLRSVHPDASPASWAIRYAASLPECITVLSGMSNLSQVEDNLSYMEKFQPLTAQEASPASWAIRYAASLPECITVLSGMSNLSQVEDNLSYMEKFQPLTAQERAVLEQATEIIHRSIAVPCTACRYCVEGCPEHINIPAYFAAYNNLKQYGGLNFPSMYYNRSSVGYGKASACIACGQCEEICPQHLPIIEELKHVAESFET